MIRLTACAKINLFLEITGKLPNGYHTLETVFQRISLGDELTFTSAADLKLTCTDSTLPVDEGNLAMRAAVRLRAALKEKRGAHIHLKKIAPMGAGLGGGSADAAVVLKGLLKLWRRRINDNVLHQLAVGLGADVPFFLTGGTCVGTGIGDELQSLKPLPKTWMVIVWPGFGVTTQEAYARVVLPFSDPQALNLKKVIEKKELFNRFESLVFPAHSKLPRLKQEFLKAGATASLMSGSGSAVFGLVRSRVHAQALHKLLKPHYPHSWVAHTL